MFRLIVRRADLFRRFLAGGAAAVVFALGVFAASPALHVWLHGHATLPSDDDCVVILFSCGVTVPLAAIAIAAPTKVWRKQVCPAASEIFLASPRYLRQPERGPPSLD